MSGGKTAVSTESTAVSRRDSRVPGLRAAAALGLTVVLVGVGASVSFAAWTAAVSKNASVSAATPAVATSGFDGLAATYKPGLPGVTDAVLADTVQATVSNSGGTPLAYGLAVSGGNATLNPLVALQVWKSGATCDATTAVAAGATTGTLAAPPLLPSDANSASAGAAVSLCLRTSITAANYAAAGGLSTSPTVSVVGTVGSNWSTTSTVAFTQTAGFTWYELVHGFSGKCMDSNGGGVAAGTTLILYPCKPLSATSNQSFRFAQVGTTAMYRIYIGAGSAAGPVVGATAALGGSGVALAAVATGDTANSNNQQWSVQQHGSAGDFRIILKGSALAPNSLCLTMSTSNDLQQYTVTTCNATTTTTNATYRAQHFSFVEVP